MLFNSNFQYETEIIIRLNAVLSVSALCVTILGRPTHQGCEV